MEQKYVTFELIRYCYDISIEVNDLLNHGKFLFHFCMAEFRGQRIPATLRFDQMYIEIMQFIETFGQGLVINRGHGSFTTTYIGQHSVPMNITMRNLRNGDSLFDYLLEFFEDIFLVFTQKPPINGSILN